MPLPISTVSNAIPEAIPGIPVTPEPIALMVPPVNDALEGLVPALMPLLAPSAVTVPPLMFRSGLAIPVPLGAVAVTVPPLITVFFRP